MNNQLENLTESSLLPQKLTNDKYFLAKVVIRESLNVRIDNDDRQGDYAMVGIVLLIAAGWALAYAIVDSAKDDDDDSSGEHLEGTDGSDTLTGGSGNDILTGLPANDLLNGEGGHDTLKGNEDNDILVGGSGDDNMHGAEGDDYVFGEDGNDSAHGDLGNDYVDGGVGNDVVFGGPDADTLVGGEGEDELQGQNGDDILSGGNALSGELTEEEQDALINQIINNETVVLPDGVEFYPTDDETPDILDGGAGNDELYIGDGDTAIGGSGEDDFYLLDGDSDAVAHVEDLDLDEDTLIYVYENADTPPELTLLVNDDGTQTLSADEEAVAIIANTALTVDDIVLLKREPTI